MVITEGNRNGNREETQTYPSAAGKTPQKRTLLLPLNKSWFRQVPGKIRFWVQVRFGVSSIWPGTYWLYTTCRVSCHKHKVPMSGCHILRVQREIDSKLFLNVEDWNEGKGKKVKESLRTSVTIIANSYSLQEYGMVSESETSRFFLPISGKQELNHQWKMAGV